MATEVLIETGYLTRTWSAQYECHRLHLIFMQFDVQVYIDHIDHKWAHHLTCLWVTLNHYHTSDFIYFHDSEISSFHI